MSRTQPPPTDLVSKAVTALFVPGDRPERFHKATASGADLIIMDLEDAVAPDAKAGALKAVLEALSRSENPQNRALVRLNVTGSATHEAELRALLALASRGAHGLLGFMVPKAEDPVYLGHLRRQLPPDLAMVALIESATGLLRAADLARIPSICRLAFGAIDFALDVASEADEVLDSARAHLVVASRAAALPAPFDSPSAEIADPVKVSASAAKARRFGFGGKLCIHPSQIKPAREAFFPSREDVEWAQSVLRANDGAAQVNGQMIDKPVKDRAKKILEFARDT